MVEERIIKSYFYKNELLLNRVVDDYYNYISTVIKNMGVANDEDREEIISDVFFVIWKNKDKLDRSLNFSLYIASVTRNLCYKKLNIEKKSYVDAQDFEDSEYIADFNLAQIVEEKEINDLIIRNLDENSEIDSRIFEMFYIEDKSIKQIAKITGLSKSNVKTKLHRIRKKIKEMLKIGGYNE